MISSSIAQPMRKLLSRRRNEISSSTEKDAANSPASKDSRADGSRNGSKKTFTPLTPTTVASDHDAFVSIDHADLEDFSAPCLDYYDTPDSSTVVENMELLLQDGVAAIQITTTATDDEDSWSDEDFDLAIDFDYGTRSSFNLKSCPAQRRSS